MWVFLVSFLLKSNGNYLRGSHNIFSRWLMFFSSQWKFFVILITCFISKCLLSLYIVYTICGHYQSFFWTFWSLLFCEFLPHIIKAKVTQSLTFDSHDFHFYLGDKKRIAFWKSMGFEVRQIFAHHLLAG